MVPWGSGPDRAVHSGDDVMRPLEQITVSDVYDTITLADIALYGGILAIGALLGIWIITKRK